MEENEKIVSTCSVTNNIPEKLNRPEDVKFILPLKRRKQQTTALDTKVVTAIRHVPLISIGAESGQENGFKFSWVIQLVS